MATLVRDEESGKLYIEDIWEFDDFVAVAEGAEMIFTEAHIEKAMERVVNNYNDSSEYGITFVTVENAIWDVITEDCDDE